MSTIDVALPDCATPGQHGVYVLFDAADEVLYIGHTKDLSSRLHGHRGTSWFREIRSVEFTSCAGLSEARALEKSMIAGFHPDANMNDALPITPPRRHALPDWTAARLVEMFEAERAIGGRRDAAMAERQALNGYIAA